MSNELHNHRNTRLWDTAQIAGISRRRFLALLAVGGATTVLAACSKSANLLPTVSSTISPTRTTGYTPPPTGGEAGKIVVTSPAFENLGVIPDKYSIVCMIGNIDKKAVNPPLQWSNVPAGTKSFAIVIWHIRGYGDLGIFWFIYNIPGNLTGIPEDIKEIGKVGFDYKAPSGGSAGTFKYITTVYALSSELTTLPNTTFDVGADWIRSPGSEYPIPKAGLIRPAMKDVILDTGAINFNVVLNDEQGIALQ